VWVGLTASHITKTKQIKKLKQYENRFQKFLDDAQALQGRIAA
jgi:uncharacterized protein YdcH (DUF465 family)